jgi:hypothetical protein
MSGKHTRALFGIILGASLVAVVLAKSTVAFAASGSDLTTSPISVNLTTSPGKTVTTTMQVQNNDTGPVNVAVKLEEFKANGESGAAQIYMPPANDPSAGWVHFSKTSFIAQPGVWNTITTSINVPKTAAYGYYYAVLFEPSVVVNGTGTTNKVKGANAVLILLNASVPNEVNSLTIKSFSVSKKVYQYLPASFSVTVHNAGQIFTVPTGDIYISRTLNGKAIDTLPINSGSGNVLPGTNRIFTSTWSNGFPDYQEKRVNGQIVSGKNGLPVQQLNWNIANASKFRFGKYYARLVLVYNDNGRDVAVNGVVSFWVIPWLGLGIILVIFALVFAGVYTIIRNILKRAKRIRR